ncbi:MAG TPA: glycosyltransferase family 4 protein [Vicinamibacterales bacterium]|nr:glycosyltransferase family 4 protein [Vicinamibacterales bacterium]
MKLAFVVQRYGTEILGGSEYHCRLIAERLAHRHQVDVLTTCARDYITWENAYPEGVDRVRGVTVRRFANAKTRDIAAFNRTSDWIFTHAHTRHDEMEWLKQQGPWSPALIEFIERHHQNYDALIFFTYLYAPTVLGLKIAPWKSLLVPTAHDEPAIRLGIYEDVFSSAAGIVWNTESEKRFVSSTFRLRALVEDVVGCGVDMPEGEAGGETIVPYTAPGMGREPLAPHIEGPANAFRRRHKMHDPFALYGGRIDPGKGCEELLEYFQTYVKEGGDATLMLMGVKLMPLPEDPHVRFAGTLPDEERLHALEAATVVVVPSPHESLSLLALEAFAVGTPILANARSEVLVDHCLKSNAGLFYEDRWEFCEALRLLMKDRDLRQAMGRNGQAYVNRHYRWGTILSKYERMLTRLSAGSGRDQPRQERPESADALRIRHQEQRPRSDASRPQQRRADQSRDRRPDRGRRRPDRSRRPPGGQ